MISFQPVPMSLFLYFFFFLQLFFLKFHMALFPVYSVPAKAVSISTPLLYLPLCLHCLFLRLYAIQVLFYLFFPEYFLFSGNISVFPVFFPSVSDIPHILPYLHSLLNFSIFHQVQNLF